MGTVQGEHHEVFRIRLPVCRCLRCSPVQQPGLWLPPSLHLWSLRPLCCPCCPLCCRQERGGDPRRGEDHCARRPRGVQRCPSRRCRRPRRLQHRRPCRRPRRPHCLLLLWISPPLCLQRLQEVLRRLPLHGLQPWLLRGILLLEYLQLCSPSYSS